MITLFVAMDESKVKEALSNLLKEGGYDVTDMRSDLKNGNLYKTFLERYEKPLIENILEQTDGNQLKAAKILGINRNTMRSRIRKLRINIERWK